MQRSPSQALPLGNPNKDTSVSFQQETLFSRGEGGDDRKGKESKKLEKLKVTSHRPPAPGPSFPEKLEPGACKAVSDGVARVYLWNDLLLFDTFTFPVKILKMVL